MKHLLFGLIGIVFCSVMFLNDLYGQDAEKNLSIEERKAAAMARSNRKAPDLPVEYRNLMRLMGRWAGDVTITQNGKNQSVEYRSLGRGASSGQALMIDETFGDSTSGFWKISCLTGFDISSGKICWYSISNKGDVLEYKGGWISNDTLSISCTMNEGGKMLNRVEMYSFKQNGEISLDKKWTNDGKEVFRLSGVVTRETPYKGKLREGGKK